MPTYAGFSPRPQPQMIASFKTKGEALAVSKPLDRDRAVDESGNQIAVFGRRGARPLTFQEMQRLLRTAGGEGNPFMVSDEPATAPRDSLGPNSGLNISGGGISGAGVVIGLLIGLFTVATVYGETRTRRAKRDR